MNPEGQKDESPEWEAPSLQNRTGKVTEGSFSQSAVVVNGEGKSQTEDDKTRYRTLLADQQAARDTLFLAEKKLAAVTAGESKLSEKVLDLFKRDYVNAKARIAEIDSELRALSANGYGVQVGSDLKEETRRTILNSEVKGFDKKRIVADLVCDYLKDKGTLYRTADGRIFFFSQNERQLYDIEQRAFTHLLIDASGLSSTETFFHFMFDTLMAYVARHGKLVEVHTLAHYHVPTEVLTISDGGGGVWRRECNGEWELGKNGDDNVLFLTESDVTPWKPEFSGKDKAGEQLSWFLDQINFGADPLSIQHQQTFLTVWLFHQFFPHLRRTRTVPAWLGPQGSGKSTTCRLIGRLLIGDSFDVSGIRKEREDAFVAAITNRVLHAVDNADTRIDWLEDALARYATGEVFRLRRLYTTNEEVTYRPRAILMLTSRDPHFQRPDVAQRLLPFYLQEIDEYLDEPSIFRELATRRNAIWGDLLSELAEVQDSLHKSVAPRLKFRMADYASFGWQVFQAQGQADEWIKALTCLDAAQMRFAAEGDGLTLALGVLLEGTDSIGPLTIKELYGKVIEIADSNSLAVPKTAEWFGRKLTSQKRVIESELNVTLLDERGHERKRRITIKKKKVSENASPASPASPLSANSSA